MKNIIILCLFFIILTTNIACNDFTIHDLVLIKKLLVGSEPGQIGYGGKITGWIAAPKCFTISDDNKIYIPDIENSRINIYDSNLNYIGMIKQECKAYCCHYSNSIIFDSKNNLICFSSDSGIIKINQTGKKIYSIDKKNIPTSYIYKDNFFIINDFLFYYDQNSYVRCIDEEGNVLGNKNSIQILNDINNKLKSADEKDEDDPIVEIKKERKKIIIGDIFYTNQFHEFKDYNKVVNRNLQNNFNIDFKKIVIERLIDYDKEHNSYWDFAYRNSKENKKFGIIVYSYDGEVIDIFHTSNLPFIKNTIIRKIAISPKGDIFYMECDGEFYYFYKIERKW